MPVSGRRTPTNAPSTPLARRMSWDKAGPYPVSPIFGQLPEDATAHWGRLPVLEQAVLEARQNVLVTELMMPAASQDLDRPLVEHTGVLTTPQTIFNVVNIVVGVGVLSVPYALKMSGYSALLVLVLVIYVTGTTARWIGTCIDLASKSDLAQAVPPNARDFGFLALVASGPKFSVFINIVTVLEIWLALVTFMVMNGVNAGLVWPWMSSSTSIPLLGISACCLIFVPQHLFAYLSLVSTLSMFTAAAAMMGATAMMHHWAEPYDSLGEAALLQLNNIPRSVGIMMFCFAGHPCFPGVVSSMKAPSQWDSSLVFSFFMAFIYYGGFGFLGYIVFGPYTMQTVTNNLSHVEGSQHLRVVAAVCFLVKVQGTVPLLLNAIIVALWAPSALHQQWPPLRVALVGVVGALTVGTALCLADKVAVVASLAGSLLVMITSVLFPAFVHLTLSRRYGDHRLGWSSIIQYAVVLSFGVVMAVLGTSMAVMDLRT